MNKKIEKYLNWEHWSVYSFYLPLIPYAFYEAFKSKHLCFFYSANPGIHHSGSGVESKYKTLQLVPQKQLPKTVFVAKDANIIQVLEEIKSKNIEFPFIIKPDIGYRGYLVKLIDNMDSLKNYISKFNEIDLIIQEFIASKNECGIFYVKKPSEEKGKITSLTLKKFLSIGGDGKSTVSQLMEKSDRVRFYKDQVKTLSQDELNIVLDVNEELQLSIVGNHSKGTQFLDGNHLIDDELVSIMDEVCSKIDGFNYGRLDIKYETFKDLKNGDFKVLEINGIIAEPTHVYDTSSEKSSYLNTLREQVKHWKLLSEIAREHHQINDVIYAPFSAFIKDLFWMKKYSKRLRALNKL